MFKALVAIAASLLCTAHYAPALGARDDARRANQPAQEAQTGGSTGKETAVMTKPPTTPFELLQNIKIALDQGLLLQEEFYTEQNLKIFSGGSQVHRSIGDVKSGPNDVLCGINGFENLIEPVRRGNITVSGLALTARRSVLPDGRISGEVRLNFQRSDPSLTFEKITQLFGPKWTFSKAVISPHLNAVSPRSRYGNARIEYVVGGATSMLWFDPDAVLNFADFSSLGGHQ